MPDYPVPNILIVGAGPVGLTAAVQLLHHGIKPRIIDRKSGPSTLSKAAAVNPRSLDLLNPPGVTEALIDAGLSVRTGNLHYEGKKLGQLHLDNIPHKYNFLLLLPQSETERVLLEHLKAEGLEVEWNRQLAGLENTETGTRAQIGPATEAGETTPDETADVDYVIGSDGPHSTVRHTLGIEFPGEKYPFDFSLADVDLDWPFPPDEVQLFMHESGILLFVAPFGGGRYRLIANGDDVKSLLPPGSTVQKTHWESDFKVHLRQATTYTQGNCYLAGDAAHVHSPAGGRGMNLGMEDATMLARRLVIGDPAARAEALATYNQERHEAGQAVLQQSDNMFKMASERDWLKRSLRNLAMPVLLASDDFQAHLLKEMAGLTGHED